MTNTNNFQVECLAYKGRKINFERNKSQLELKKTVTFNYVRAV